MSAEKLPPTKILQKNKDLTVQQNTNLALNEANSLSGQILQQLDNVILGKSEQNKVALTCLIANGHLLIEDLPGCGKTTQAHALAITLGLDFKRIQFTPDLMPSDITGTDVIQEDPQTGERAFKFIKGPFLSESIYNGVYSSLVAICMLLTVFQLLQSDMPDFLNIQDFKSMGIIFACIFELESIIYHISVYAYISPTSYFSIL